MSQGILVIEDDAVTAKNIQRYMRGHGYDVQVAASGEQGLQQFEEFKPDLVLLDFSLPGKDGLEILRRLRQLDPRVKVILITGHGNVQLAVDAMKTGARDYLSKPVVLSELKLLIDKVVGQERMEGALSYYQDKEAEQSGLGKILGNSPALKSCKQRILQLLEAERELADDEFPAVLITGETGTGKELVARALHYDGVRKDHPFVEVNCATIPTHLLESELFGYERGAFTDARSRKIGLVESADGGTVFLDEIGTLDTAVQAKLLKLLEDKTVRRLGNVRDRKVNIRIIAATNEPLAEAVRDGKFRSDLYYRLKVISLELPPLRERGEDIILLAEHFLKLLGGRYKKPRLKFSAAARDDLSRYFWPGNVRELRNLIEQTVLMTTGDVIEPGFLPRHPVLARAEIQEIKDPTARVIAAFSGDSIRIEDVESGLIAKALESCAGNVTKAAKALGMSRDALRYRMEKYKLRPPS